MVGNIKRFIPKSLSFQPVHANEGLYVFVLRASVRADFLYEVGW